MTMSNLVICPNCGHENIEGTDQCENCLSDLRTWDVPSTEHPVTENELSLPLSEVQLSKPVVIGADATLGDALDVMAERKTEALVVVGAEGIVGVFTERDVLKRVAAQGVERSIPITDVMTHDPVVLREDDSVAVAMNKMGGGGFRHIPLSRDGEVVAMVTVRDVLKWVLGQYFG